MTIKNQNKQTPRPSKIQVIRDKKMWGLIKSYAENTGHPFTWKDVKEHLIETYGILSDIHVIRRILKEQMNYSYRRWSPRPLLIDRSVWRIKKVLFAVKLLKIINNSTVLINIDESSISDSTKANYSWGLKGISKNISATIIKGSINLVTAILSNGISITGIKSGTVKSDTFIEFIEHLLNIWYGL